MKEEEERTKYKRILKHEKFFAPFNDEELDELLESGEVKKYAINEYIIKEDNVDYTFFVILRGQVSIINPNYS
ncbi:MAG: cyclic nucleotide-binding domain-containing protein [Nitrospinota bacterium]